MPARSIPARLLCTVPARTSGSGTPVRRRQNRRAAAGKVPAWGARGAAGTAESRSGWARGEAKRRQPDLVRFVPWVPDKKGAGALHLLPWVSVTENHQKSSWGARPFATGKATCHCKGPFQCQSPEGQPRSMCPCVQAKTSRTMWLPVSRAERLHRAAPPMSWARVAPQRPAQRR
eukprot:355040-Chlamydomonas_euryale.AAC.3